MTADETRSSDPATAGTRVPPGAPSGCPRMLSTDVLVAAPGTVAATGAGAATGRAGTVGPALLMHPFARGEAARGGRRARSSSSDLALGDQVRRTPCATHDVALWFAASPAGLEEAKALCGGCSEREACLAGAVERREPWGVWGGEIFDAGVVVAFKRGRGRPPRS